RRGSSQQGRPGPDAPRTPESCSNPDWQARRKHLSVRRPSSGRKGNRVLRHLKTVRKSERTMSAAAIDHPFFKHLVGDEEAAALFSVEAEIEALLQFELALARAEGRHGVIPAEAVPAVEAGLKGFTPDVEAIAEGIGNDGVIAPAFLKQLRSRIAEPYRQHLHVGATSQDVIDTGLALRLTKAITLIDHRLGKVIDDLAVL